MPSRQPSTQPSSLPSKCPSSHPTSRPTISAHPTSSPSLCPTVYTTRLTSYPTSTFSPTSAPTGLYDGFFASNLISRFEAASAPQVVQLLSVNTDVYGASSNAGPLAFTVLKQMINIPRQLNFYSISIATLVAREGERAVMSSVNCSSESFTNDIIQAFKSNVDFDKICGGYRWEYKSQSLFYDEIPVGPLLPRILCINCNNHTCIDSVYETNFVLGSSDLCFMNTTNSAIRTATYLQIEFTILVPPTIPIIDQLDITARSTELSINVTYTGQAPGGKIYCAAVERTTVPYSSLSQFLSVASLVSYIQPINIISVPGRVAIIVIKNLSPATAYSVLCAGMDSQGNTDDFKSQILPQLQTHYTACCRTISFQVAPNSVYGDLNVYSGSMSSRVSAFSSATGFTAHRLASFSNSQSNTHQFVFSYSVQISGLDVLQVIPVVMTAAKGFTQNITVTPSSVTSHKS
jgi:hypothetical protein